MKPFPPYVVYLITLPCSVKSVWIYCQWLCILFLQFSTCVVRREWKWSMSYDECCFMPKKVNGCKLYNMSVTGQPDILLSSTWITRRHSESAYICQGPCFRVRVSV